MDKEKIVTIIMYGIAFLILAIGASIIGKRSPVFIIIFGSIIMILGIFFGFLVTSIIYSKEGRGFFKMNKNSLNERELLFSILLAIISWQLLKYYWGDFLVIKIAGLLIGFYLGLGIVKLMRKLRNVDKK